MTLFELPSSEDHIRVKHAIDDKDQCEHLLETFKFKIPSDVSKGLNFSVFLVEGCFQFSIEQPDSGCEPEEFEQFLRYQIAVCRIVNLDIRVHPSLDRQLVASTAWGPRIQI